jgi:hypothetical protein
MKRMTRTIAGLVACLMLALALPATAQTETAPPASAETQDRIGDAVERMRERVLIALDRRLDRIDRLQFEIGASDTVEPENAAHLTADLSASQGGLTALEAQARSAKTVEELGAIVDDMVSEHRIFALRTPQTRLVLGSDFGVAIADRLGAVADTLDAAAARAAEAGYDVSEVEGLIGEARTSTSQGLAVVEPVAGTVLPLEPEDVPDPARTVMEQARDDMIDGREAYRSARDTLRDAARLLRDIVGLEAA